MQETWVLSLGWEDPLKEGMATHCNILAWRILWTEEPGRLYSMGLQIVWARLRRFGTLSFDIIVNLLCVKSSTHISLS